jgi:ATP-dependent DNA helicase RecG
MGKHPSQPANPDVARALFLAGKIESWGRGIDLIRNACLDYGSPEPRFACDGAGFWVEFPFAASAEAEKTSVETSVETSAKTPVETLAARTPEAILVLLTANPAMSLAEVAAKIGKTQRTIELASAKLVKEGKLKHFGPKKGGRWQVLEVLK